MTKPSKTTAATRWLLEQKVPFEEHLYHYVDHGGAPEAARQLGVPPEQVIKSLVLEDAEGQALLVLMHGDREVSLKALARAIGTKSVKPCKPQVAQRWTGYQVGGISPFGTKTQLPVYVQQSVLDLERIWINGGQRGRLLAGATAALLGPLRAVPVDCAQP